MATPRNGNRITAVASSIPTANLKRDERPRELVRRESVATAPVQKREERQANYVITCEPREAIEQAVKRIQLFYKAYERSPTAREAITELRIGSIITSANAGRFKDLGVEKWNDILTLAGVPVNLARNQWTTEKAVKEVTTAIKDFYFKNGRAPSSKDDAIELGIISIIGPMYRGALRKFGIMSWNDLLRKAGVPLNKPHTRITKERVDDAIKKMQRFKSENGRMPSTNEFRFNLGLNGIFTAICRGYLKQFGIASWKDLVTVAENAI